MPTVNDTLGDALAAWRVTSLDDAVTPGLPVVIHLQSNGLDAMRHDLAYYDNEAVTGEPKYDFDLPFTATAGDLVNRFRGAAAYTGMSSISLILEPGEKQNPIPSFFELALEAASAASFHFGSRMTSLAGILPDDDPLAPVRFHADVFAFPNRDLAGRFVEWRQTLNHREATAVLGRRHMVYNAIMATPLAKRREALELAGADFSGRLEDVLQGQLVRRQLIQRFPSDREISKMLRAPKKLSLVTRAIYVADKTLPSLSRCSNLTDVVFDGADPVLPELPLARAVSL